MILDHETPEEVHEARFTAEKELDRVYHAIPEWVHRLYPNLPLSEKIRFGFEYQQKEWTETFLREVKDHEKVKKFLIFLMETHGFDYMEEYWKFLISKDLKNTAPEEKEVLTKMKRTV